MVAAAAELEDVPLGDPQVLEELPRGVGEALEAVASLLADERVGPLLAGGAYMLLIGRIGAEYAAYVTLLMPVIALVISTLFEGYRWTGNALFGVALVLAGNLIILTPQSIYRRVVGRFKGRENFVKSA